MSCYILKLIAVVTMALDHIGYLYGILPLRILGRISFPIFAFLIANGFRFTANRAKYAGRLAAFAVISEIPYDLLFGAWKITICTFGRYLPHPQFDNVFFTLLCGLLFLMLRDFLHSCLPLLPARLLSAVALVAFGGVAAYCNNDYGAVGVFTVALFGVLDVRRVGDRLPLSLGLLILSLWNALSKWIVAGCMALGFDLCGIPGMSLFFSAGAVSPWNLMQILRMAALPLLFFYNGERGISKEMRGYKVVQYGFYAFYPLHLLLLWGIAHV